MEFQPLAPLTFKTDVNIDSDGCVAQSGIAVAGIKSLSFPMMSSSVINRWSDTNNFAASIIETLGGGSYDYLKNRLSVDYETSEEE